MALPMAYFALALIWATTPLAIKWSADGAGFLFAAGARLALGAAIALTLLALMRPAIPWNREARRAYLIAGIALYLGMSVGYWGAQFIPSGLISILFGLAPIATALFAAWWLDEPALSARQLMALLMALAGLVAIFRGGIALGPHAGYGIAAWLFATLLHSAATVGLKRYAHAVPNLSLTAVSLLIAAMLDALTWVAGGTSWPQHAAPRAIIATIYLAVFGSTIAYLLYYYALKRLRASQMALITLITPALALTIGGAINGERLSASLAFGAALIVGGLALHQWDGLRARRSIQKANLQAGRDESIIAP